MTIAVQACLLTFVILGLDYYAGWQEIIVYPNEFVPRHEHIDEAGVVHVTRHPMAGESWPRGPVVLSWADTAAAFAADGMNVVIHEFAHKLDMLNGDANGFPPLPKGMDRTRWAAALSAAYAAFTRQVESGVVNRPRSVRG